MPEIDPAERVKQIEERAQKAREMISALCLPRGSAGHREWIMSIPARPDYDPDIVISDSLKDIPWLLSRMKEREELRKICAATAEMVMCIQNWLGSASTREAAMESLWRVARMLQRNGFSANPQNELEWRGVIIKAMEDAGIGLGDDDKVRLRAADHKPWEHSKGELVTVVLAKLAAAEAEAEELRAELAQQQQISFHMDGAVADLRSRAESAEKLLGSMREALRKLYSKRAAKIAAKEALREFRAEHGSCLDEGNSVDVPTLRCFREPDKPKEQWCEVCLGSQPLWEARQKAQAQAAAALRSILRIAAKLESENQAESVLSAANETKEEG